MDRFSAHMDRSWDMLSRGKTGLAMMAARQALEINSNAPDVHNLIGYIHAIDGQFEDALEHYLKAIDLDEWYLEPLLNAAEIQAHPDENPLEAIRLCRRATEEMSLTPEEFADATLIEVDALLNIGEELQAAARIQSLENVESLPAVYQAIFGRALFDMGNLEGASEFAARAISTDTPSPEAWYLQGLITREEGKRIESVVAFLSTRASDIELPRVPWQQSDEELNKKVEQALKLLPSSTQAMFANTTIDVQPYPSVEDICNELDPRQVIRASHIDPANRTFLSLTIFSLNSERIISPRNFEEELSQIIALEVGIPIPPEPGKPDTQVHANLNATEKKIY